MKSKKRLLFTSFHPARDAGLMLAASILMLIAVTFAFGQDPVSSIAQAPTANQADVTKSGDQNRSNPGGQVVGGPQGPATPSEKERLAVNPVTGLVTSSASNYKPLTGKERWKLYWKQNYLSVGAYFGPVFTALVLDQATNSPAQWGGGFSGYGRRLASRTGSAIIQGTFQAPVAEVLHEDVRYISSAQQGGKRRALHAVVYSFLTYNSQGHPTLNLANLGGYYASTAISTTWLPGHYSVAKYTLTNGTEQIGLGVPVNLLQEFWPEVTHKVLHRH